MSDTTRSNQPNESSSVTGGQDRLAAGGTSAQPNESPSVTGGRQKPKGDVLKVPDGQALPVSDDQPTVISNRPPLSLSQLDAEGRITLGELAPGDRLGHFELLDYVGGGGMGRVFRALDTELDRVVALKVLPRQQATDEETLLRFRNEARSAARLDHDNIARVFYVGEDRGLPYLVFEFVEGSTVRKLVEQNGSLPLAEAVNYTLQVADALAHAAEHNVVHRDVKPSNILITPEGRVKVIDMGLARLQQIQGAANDLTVSGVTLGTFDYISPEQARDPRSVDVRSDIYSLGCAFFFMLSGRPPFPEGTMLQKLLRHQADEPPDIRQFRPDLPQETSDVLRKMLAKEPHRRFQNPSELIEQLLLLAHRVGLRTVGPGQPWKPPREPAVSRFRRHLPWIVPVAALVCIVVLLDHLWSLPAGKENRLVGGPEEFVPELPGATDFVPPGRSTRDTDTRRAKPPPSATLPDGPTATPLLSPAAAHDIEKTPPGAPPAPMPPPTSRLPSRLPTDPSARTSPSEVPAAGNAPEDMQAEPGEPTPSTPDLSTPDISTPGPGASDVEGLTTPRSTVPPNISGVLIVDGIGKGENAFSTLGAACNAAAGGDIIELRYNGRREEKPITLPNVKLTICAGEGFQPVVLFRPVEMDPVKYPRSMLTLIGGRLTLLGVAIELEIPREVPAQRWSLLEMGRTESLRLDGCSLTVRNASDRLDAFHEEVAFLRIRAAPGVDAAVQPKPATVATIELVDCVVRGEAVLVRAEDLQPFHLTWENGLLVTTEQLLLAEGGQETPPSGEVMRIDLQHLTAVVRTGLCRLVGGEFAPYQLPTHLSCTDSILMASPGILMASPGGTLIEQLGGRSEEELRKRIVWNGERNFYQGFNVFWSTGYVNPEMLPQQWSFDAWQSYWTPDHENHSRLGRVDWRQLPDPTRPLHTHTPADYTLNDTPAGASALRAARGGIDAGLQADRLPPLPPPSRETPLPMAHPTPFPR